MIGVVNRARIRSDIIKVIVEYFPIDNDRVFGSHNNAAVKVMNCIEFHLGQKPHYKYNWKLNKAELVRW